jgi:ubiquinone/menaquinone biosynthesis C-methylase UbiE
MMIWLIVLLLLLIIGLIVYWQFILAEGAYLGAPLVALLYDWTAERYNQIKGFDEEGERLTLGLPLMNRLYFQPDALVLDVATGTGRLPLALFRERSYRGQIIGLDRASKMLAVAQRDLAAYQDRILFIQADAMALPFASNSVPVVTCLEALEFLPNPQKGLAELVRVLQPATARHTDRGWLLTTNRIGWEARLMPGKTWTTEQLRDILKQMPLRYIDIRLWQTIYDQVWAQKIKPSRQHPE